MTEKVTLEFFEEPPGLNGEFLYQGEYSPIHANDMCCGVKCLRCVQCWLYHLPKDQEVCNGCFESAVAKNEASIRRVN